MKSFPHGNRWRRDLLLFSALSSDGNFLHDLGVKILSAELTQITCTWIYRAGMHCGLPRCKVAHKSMVRVAVVVFLLVCDS